MPGFIEPALATSIEKVPSGRAMDSRNQVRRLPCPGSFGQRGGARSSPGAATTGPTASRRSPTTPGGIKATSAVVDGEIVVPAADGTTDFSVLQNELKGKSTKIVLVAFDLLYLNGRDLRKLPLIQRKAELRKIVDGTEVQFSESFEIEGREMFAHACKLGLEGVVSKVRDGPYPKGRTSDWVKKTCVQRETLTIAGFALDEESGTASMSAGARATI